MFGHTLEALTYAPGVVKQLGGENHLTPPDEAGLPGVDALVPVSWAVLLHDIGKPVVRTVTDDGRVIFWHHDEMGRRMAADIGVRLHFSTRFIAYVGTLIVCLAYGFLEQAYRSHG